MATLQLRMLLEHIQSSVFPKFGSVSAKGKVYELLYFVVQVFMNMIQLLSSTEHFVCCCYHVAICDLTSLIPVVVCCMNPKL